MNKSKGVVLLAMVFFGLSLAVGAQNLTIMTEQNAPFNFGEGSAVKGIAADLLVYMMKETGRTLNPGDVQVMPWARAYETVQKEPNTLLFSMARTEQRENLFRWVGPIYRLEIGLLAPKSRSIAITSPADFARYRIATVRDGAPEQLLVNAGADISRLDRGASLEANLKKLQAGRVDMVAFNIPAALYNLKSLGANVNQYGNVYTLRELDLYFAFNPQTDAQLIDALQGALEKARRTGVYDTIVSRYMN